MKEIRQGNRFLYPRRMVTSDRTSCSEVGVQKKMQVGVRMYGEKSCLIADRKTEEVERESLEVVCNISIPIWSGDSYSDRSATTEAVGLQEQLGQEDCGSEEGE